MRIPFLPHLEFGELAVRGLARRVLIITPASLVGQGQAELQTKFFARFMTRLAAGDWQRSSHMILSYDRARQKVHREQIMKHPLDLVIVDEAHKLKNDTSAAFQLMRDIANNFILLLTRDAAAEQPGRAVQPHNDAPAWPARHMERVPAALPRTRRPRRARDPDAVRDLTASVMVRTFRSSVAHDLAAPPRKPSRPRIQLSDAEARLYRLMAGFVRNL